MAKVQLKSLYTIAEYRINRGEVKHLTIHYLKTVYDPPAAEDGMRLIIMRRYPRGIAKSRAHAWLPELAPTLPLVHWYHDQLKAIKTQWKHKDPEWYDQEIARFWKTYSQRYLREMKEQRHLIEFLASLHRGFGVTLTLLCTCPDHRLCHRSLLAGLIDAA